MIKHTTGIIYLTICLINGLIYVGRHHTSADTYFGSGVLIKRSVNKHKKEILIKNVLYTSISEASRKLNISRRTIRRKYC